MLSNFSSPLRILFLLSALCSGGSLPPLSAYAQESAVSFSDLGSGSNYYQGQSYSLGWSFTTTSDVSVSALGFYDDQMNGLTEAHEVGIFDASNCQLLASTIVQPSDPLIGFFRYRNIVPVILPGGRGYYTAAVTGSEKYAIAVTSITTHPSIVFGGFSIHGQTTPTDSLLCPNGSQAPGFNGDFGPNFLIGGEGLGGGGNGGGQGSGKRPTAINLFCNRTGPNLETADCNVTVGDTGAPPRIFPTGIVEFVADGGFFPGSAECLLGALDFSPGVSSCRAQFAIPQGFPIGTAFPINAVYSGSDIFESSATAHELIRAGCVGTPDSPCPDSIGLSFDEYPRLVKDRMAFFINCGQLPASSLAPRITTMPAEDKPSNGECSVDGKSSLDVAKFLMSLSDSDRQEMGAEITKDQAKGEIMLQVIKESNEINRERWKLLMETQEAIFKIQDDVLRNRVPLDQNGKIRWNKWESYIRSARVDQAKTKRPVPDRLTSETLSIKIKRGTQKRVSLKSGKRLKLLSKVARKAGLASLPIKLSLKVKQKGVRGSGKIERTFDAALR